MTAAPGQASPRTLVEIDIAPALEPPPPPLPGEHLGEADLSELLSAFNALSARMQRSHDALTGEVSRLKDELGSANERLRRSERLAAIGHMAAGIAHEIRNPLASIQLYGEILAKDLAGDEALQPLALKICAAVQGLDAIVRDVLAFAREVKIRPSDLAVEEVLASAIADSGALMRDAGVQIAAPNAEPRPCTICADHSLLRIVFGNVIRNAVEAMAELTGDEPRRLDVLVNVGHDERQGEVVTITFRDTGPGLTAEVRERMFNPFFTTRAAGTGLGLAIVHRILEAHGAWIEARSREDARGAEIIITLPLSARGDNCVETSE